MFLGLAGQLVPLPYYGAVGSGGGGVAKALHMVLSIILHPLSVSSNLWGMPCINEGQQRGCVERALGTEGGSANMAVARGHREGNECCMGEDLPQRLSKCGGCCFQVYAVVFTFQEVPVRGKRSSIAEKSVICGCFFGVSRITLSTLVAHRRWRILWENKNGTVVPLLTAHRWCCCPLAINQRWSLHSRITLAPSNSTPGHVLLPLGKGWGRARGPGG